MNDGRLTPAQVRGWVANRFHYQQAIPVKDAAILSNCPVVGCGGRGSQRVIDHDGRREGEGGLAAWLRLAEAVGLRPDEVLDGRAVPARPSASPSTRTSSWPGRGRGRWPSPRR